MNEKLGLLAGVVFLAPIWVTAICIRQPPGSAHRMVRGLGYIWAIAFCLAVIGATATNYAWETTLAFGAATWLLLSGWIASVVTELKNKPPEPPAGPAA